MKIGAGRQLILRRLGGSAICPADDLRQDQLLFLIAATAEGVDRRKVDRQVIAFERQCPRRGEPRVVLDQPSLLQPEDDRVGIVGRQELPLGRRRRDLRSGLVVEGGEDAEQARALVLATFDPECHSLAELVELADLDRCAKRARLQLEPQSFVPVAGIRVDPADYRDVHEQQAGGEHVRDPKQPTIADADAAHRVEFGTECKLAKGEQDSKQQADRDPEREIFGQQVGEHPPHDAYRAARGDHEIE